MEKLFVGQLLGATTTFRRRAGGVLFDPAAVVFKFKDPNGNIITREEPVKLSKGVYEAQVPLAVDGTWWGRTEGHDEAGDTIAANEYDFPVEESNF